MTKFAGRATRRRFAEERAPWLASAVLDPPVPAEPKTSTPLDIDQVLWHWGKDAGSVRYDKAMTTDTRQNKNKNSP